MPTHEIKGFPRYFVFEHKLYRKAYKTKSKSCKWQYRNEREIKQTFKDGKTGFWMVKYNKRIFVSTQKLKELSK